MGRSPKADMAYIKQRAETLYESLHLRTPRPKNVDTLHFLYKTWAFYPKTLAFNPKIDRREPVPNTSRVGNKKMKREKIIGK